MRTLCVLAVLVFSLLAQAHSLSAASIYWTAAGSVRRAALDGSDVQTLVTPTNSYPVGLAVDARNARVYWVSHYTSEFLLQRANLDGSAVENLVPADPGAALGWGRPRCLAIDETGAASRGVPKLYLGGTDTDQIKRANLSGAGLEAVVSGLPNDSYVLGIAVDASHQKVYWANCCPDNGPPSISRANVDGSLREEIVLEVDPAGLALDLFGRKVYWASRDTASIWRADLDGTQREQIVTNAGDYFPIAINHAARKLYWADPTNLWQANLDGSARQLLVPGADRIEGIAVDTGLPPHGVGLIPLTNEWRYNQSGLDLGTAWREAAYDDSAWPAGEAVLAYEVHPLVTPLIRTPLNLETNGARIVTYYFRTHFQVASLNADYLLAFSNLVDDGAVFYLNGVEILRHNMPTGPIDWQTRAVSPLAVNGEGIFVLSNAPASNLVPGDNLLAVEVHQSDLDSSDVTFGLTLQQAPQVPLYFTIQPGNSADYVGNRPTLLGRVAGSFPRYHWLKDGQPIPGATNNIYQVPELGPAGGGHYQLVATNHVSAVTSAVATVTAILNVPVNPFVLLSAGPASDAGGGLIVIFTHTLETSSGLNPTNYVLTRAGTGAVVPILNLAAYGGNAVRLTTGPLTPGTNYLLTVNNVLSASGPLIPPNSRVSVSSMVQLFSYDAVWRYNDSGNDLGTDWREVDFNDAAWPSGPGLLHNDQNFNPPAGTLPRTLLSVTNAAGQSIVTHYFRRHFTPQAFPAMSGELSLGFIVDDGAIVYLNGREIARHNMPNGNVTASTRASSSASEGAINSRLFSSTNLVEGDNVLAVEVHQFSLMSPNLPDLSFGLQAGVRADSFANVPPQVLRQPVDVTVAERAPASLFADVMAATQVQWFRSGVPIAGATSRTLSFPQAAVSDSGVAFTLVAANSFGAVTSSIARLKVLADTEPPQLLGAQMGTNATFVTVTFSEAFDLSSASQFEHYSIRDQSGQALAIHDLYLPTDRVAVLTTDPRVIGARYRLTVEGVTDTAARRNAVRDEIPVGYEVLHLSWEHPWRYDETGADLGAAWREPAYDDAAWPTGPGLLGFEDSSLLPESIRTVLTPPEFRGPVYYFRTRFAFTAHPGADAVWLRYFADDGAVFFLNGLEAHRIRVPDGQNYVTFATLAWEATLEGPQEIPRGALVDGVNLLAAELHQVSTVSADCVFGAQLTEAFGAAPLRAVRPRLHWERNGGQVALSWDQLAFVLECAATPNGPWQRASAPAIPYTVSPSDAAKYFRLRR